MAEVVFAARRRPRVSATIALSLLGVLIFGGGLTVAFVADARYTARQHAIEQKAADVAVEVAAAQLVRDTLSALLEKEQARADRLDAELSDTAGLWE